MLDTLESNEKGVCIGRLAFRSVHAHMASLPCEYVLLRTHIKDGPSFTVTPAHLELAVAFADDASDDHHSASEVRARCYSCVYLLLCVCACILPRWALLATGSLLLHVLQPRTASSHSILHAGLPTHFPATPTGLG